MHLSLYKLNDTDPLYPADGPTAMPIDAPDILHESCAREVHVRPSIHPEVMNVLPDNAGFVVSVCNPLVSFFGLTVLPTGKLLVVL